MGTWSLANHKPHSLHLKINNLLINGWVQNLINQLINGSIEISVLDNDTSQLECLSSDPNIIAGLVDGIWHTTEDVLIQFTSTFCGQLLGEYLETLNHEDKLQVIQACMIVWVVTKGCVIPHVFQLKVSLAMLHQCNSLIIAVTGSGKILCLLIPLLLCPQSISIIVSPLKHLQSTQVRWFMMLTISQTCHCTIGAWIWAVQDQDDHN